MALGPDPLLAAPPQVSTRPQACPSPEEPERRPGHKGSARVCPLPATPRAPATGSAGAASGSQGSLGPPTRPRRHLGWGRVHEEVRRGVALEGHVT